MQIFVRGLWAPDFLYKKYGMLRIPNFPQKVKSFPQKRPVFPPETGYFSTGEKTVDFNGFEALS